MPAGVKRVPTSWKPSDQAWRTLAQCLGYSTPLDPPPARKVPGINMDTDTDESNQDSAARG